MNVCSRRESADKTQKCFFHMGFSKRFTGIILMFIFKKIDGLNQFDHNCHVENMLIIRAFQPHCTRV